MNTNAKATSHVPAPCPRLDCAQTVQERDACLQELQHVRQDLETANQKVRKLENDVEREIKMMHKISTEHARERDQQWYETRKHKTDKMIQQQLRGQVKALKRGSAPA